MKIVLLVSSLLIGGSSQVVSDLADGLSKKAKVSVISIWDLFDQKYKDSFNKNGINTFSCNKKNKFDYFCYKNLKKILVDEKPDVILTNLTSLFYCWLCKLDIPIVHIIHSEPKLDIPFIYRILMSRSIKRGKIKLIGCSQSVTRKARQVYKRDVTCINNGISFPVIEEKEKKYDFIFTGRLCGTKRLFDLLDAVKLMQIKNKNISLCIVGDGPLNKKLQNYVRKNDIKNVEFVGRQSNVYEFLAQSRVFCLFSAFEGGPICLLEAMHCGLPIVCSNAGGNLNFAKNMENALVFEVGNVPKAAELMSKYLDDQNLYHKHSKKSKAMSLKFSSQNMVDSYYNYLTEIVEKGN